MINAFKQFEKIKLKIKNLEEQFYVFCKHKYDNKKVLNTLEKELSEGLISKSKYQLELNKKTNGKTTPELVEHYDAKINDCKLEINHHINKIKLKKTLSFSYLSIIVLILFFLSFNNPSFTGFIIAENTVFTEENINLIFEDSNEYEWITKSNGKINYIKISGEIIGNGSGKIYFGDLLIFNSESLNRNISNEKVIFLEQCEETCKLNEFYLNQSHKFRSELNETKITINKISYEIINLNENISEINETNKNENVIKNETEEIKNETIIKEINNTINNIQNVSIITEQEEAFLDMPVKWKKTLNVSSNYNISIDLPSNAEEIKINKINLIENTSAIVSNVEKNEKKEHLEINIKNNGSNEYYEITYETPSPDYTEEETSRGKKIKISSNMHYQNIFTYTDLDENLNIQNIDKIKIYWVENNSYIEDISIQDRNSNGIYDYIGWIVPHLSNQTFEIIIITNAEHLDENKILISDIYNEVNSLNDVWSPIIKNGEYVRVTFEIPLNSSRDITIFPKVISGNPIIQVYEYNKSILLAEFNPINNNNYNKIYLTNLVGDQDSFDLKIINGDLQFDHIIDPQNVLSVSETNMGMMVYIESTIQLPRYRMFNTSTGLFDTQELNATSVGATIEHLWLRCAPNRYECALLTADSADDLKIQFYSYNSSGDVCWNNGTACNQVVTLDANLIAQNGEKAALEYENASGNLLIVWANSTEDGLEYALWDGNDFVTRNVHVASSLVTTGAPEWLETAQEPGTNNISLIYATANDQAGIIRWDGDAQNWGCEMPSVIPKVGHLNTPRVDIAHEQLSGDLFAIIGRNTTHGVGFNYTTKAKNSCTYTQATVALTEESDTARVTQVWGTNRILITTLTTTGADSEFLEWNGTGFATNSPGDTAIYAPAAGNELVTGVCVHGADRCIVVYSDAATSTGIDWYTLTPSTNTFTLQTDIAVGMTDEEEAIRCYPYPAGDFSDDKILCIFEDDTDDLWALNYDSSGNVWTTANATAGAFESSTLLAEYRSFSFDFIYSQSNPNYVDIVSPLISIITPSNNTNFTLTNINVNYTASDIESGLNSCWYTNSSGRFNTTLTCSNNLTGINWPQGVNNITIYANDTSGNINQSSTRFFIDNIYPLISISYPENSSNFTSTSVEINYTLNEININNCWWSNSSGLFNRSLICGTNITSNNWGLGMNNISVYANDTSGNINQSRISFNVSVIQSNSAPHIYKIFNNTLNSISITENSFTNIIINFSVIDSDGASDLVDTTSKINVTKEGEAIRQNSSCSEISSSGNEANYSCIVQIWYFDGAGMWNISASIEDSEGELATNISNSTFVLQETTAFTLNPNALTFASISPGASNITSNNDPLIFNNTGNKEINSTGISINATNLVGETNPLLGLYAGNFSISNNTGSSIECSGTNLQKGNFIIISSANITRGNHSLNNGIANEQLYLCLNLAGNEINSQAYSTLNEGAWTIRVLVILGLTTRKRKKIKNDKLFKALMLITDELKEKHSITKSETISLIITELKDKYGLKKKEIISIAENQNNESEIPIEIFKKDLGALESVCKYLKENLGMNYSEIAQITNRNERTIWTAYNKSLKKYNKKLEIKNDKIRIPINKINNKEVTILESTIIYLKNKGFKFAQIGKMLERDQRNVRIIYLNAVAKLKKKV